MSTIKLNTNKQLEIETGAEPINPLVFSRPIHESDPLMGRTIPLDGFINVMLDRRAPGLWTGLIGGPKSKMEHLAEVTIRYNLLPDIAESLLDHTLIRKVNEKIVRANQRMKRDIFIIDYSSLLAAVSGALGATTSITDPKRILARIITELLSKAYLKLSVMTPFVGAAQLEQYTTPVASLDALIEASDVALVTEVFESIELGSAFKDVKEFDPRIAETLLGPLLVAAANRLLNVVRYTKYMQATAILVAKWLCQADDFPSHLRDDSNIRGLATNFSFTYDALARVNEVVRLPDFELREALAYTAVRVRELSRFETVSLDRFAQTFTHELVTAPSGYVCGVILSKAENFALAAQVTKFVERKEFTIQCPVEVAEAYMRPITEAITTAFSGNLLGRSVSVAAQHMLTRKWELDGEDAGAHVFTYGVTPIEELIYALSFKPQLYITNLADRASNGLDAPTLMMQAPAGRMFYNPKGWLANDYILTADPIEIVLMSNASREATAVAAPRPQVIPNEFRTAVLDGVPTQFIASLGRKISLVLPRPDGSELALRTSLQDLLGLESLGRLAFTLDHAAYNHVTNAFASLCFIYDELKRSTGEVDGVLAHQVANATHALLGRLSTTEPFRRMLITMHAGYMQDAQTRLDRAGLRTHLESAIIQHQMILNAAMMVLLKTGVLEFGLQDNLRDMFAAERVVETAITSEQWAAAMKPVF